MNVFVPRDVYTQVRARYVRTIVPQNLQTHTPYTHDRHDHLTTHSPPVRAGERKDSRTRPWVLRKESPKTRRRDSKV